MAGTIIRKSTACEPHGEAHERKVIQQRKHGTRGPKKFLGYSKTKRSRKY